MNLTLQLPPQVEARLKEQASRTGRSLEQLALEALEERLAGAEVEGESLPPSSRLAEFRAWLAKPPPVPLEHWTTRERASTTVADNEDTGRYERIDSRCT